MKLIIPMAGRGTRVRPHSHVTPKPLLHIKGKSMVERIVDTFARVLPRKPSEAVYILAPDFGNSIKEQLSELSERTGIKARFAVQDVPMGTGHAVYAAKEYLEGEGIVVFADTLFDMEPGVDLEDADVVAWVKEVEDPSAYGVAVRDGDRITDFVEKPTTLISNEALIGIYYIKELKQLHDQIKRLIDEEMLGKTGEYYLTDAFDLMLKAGLVFKTAHVTEWLDCGTIPALMNTTRYILEKESENGTAGQVVDSIIREPVYIAPGATVTGSIIGPNVSVEADAAVVNSVLTDTIVFAHAKVSNAVLKNSMIGQYADVNEGARQINVGDHSALGFS